MDKDKAKFTVGPASSFESKQTANGITIAAVPYETDDQARPAFGKENPYKHGVLPVLVVIQNDSKGSIRLDSVRVEYIDPDRERIEATPARDVPFLNGPPRPGVQKPIPVPLPKKKNPLAATEIQERAFAAKMLPAGDSAHGFFYFQTGFRGGSKLYITGVTEAATGKELLYFEIPLARPK